MWTAAAVMGGATVAGSLIGADSADRAGDKQAQGAQAALGETLRQYDQSRSDLEPYRSAGQAALTRLSQLLGIGAPGGIDETDQRYKDIYDRHFSDYDQAHQQRFGMPLMASPDARGLSAALQSIKDSARKEYIANYGADTGTGVDSSPLLRKFQQSDLNADPVYQNGLQFGLDEGTKALERRASATGGYDSGGTLKALTRYANDYGSTKAADAYGRFTSDQDRTYGKLSGVAGMGSGATNVGVNAGANAAGNLASIYTGAANAAGAATIAGGNALTSGLNNIGQYALLSRLRPQDQLTGGGQRAIDGAGTTGGNDYPG